MSNFDELADAEPGGLMACSPEIYAQIKADNAWWEDKEPIMEIMRRLTNEAARQNPQRIYWDERELELVNDLERFHRKHEGLIVPSADPVTCLKICMAFGQYENWVCRDFDAATFGPSMEFAAKEFAWGQLKLGNSVQIERVR